MATKPSKTVLKEVQDFRDSVKRVVGLLSGKNIPVAECGDTAYVRYNKRVNQSWLTSHPYQMTRALRL